MSETITMLAKHYSTKLLEQILFIKIVGESINELEETSTIEKYEVGAGSDE